MAFIGGENIKPHLRQKIKKLNIEIDSRHYKNDPVINLLKEIIIDQQKQIDELNKVIDEIIKEIK